MAETVADPKDVALSALTHLIRLMGAELTVGRHHDDVDLLERAMRVKLQSLAADNQDDPGVQAGLALAADHVAGAIRAIRNQAESTRDAQAVSLSRKRAEQTSGILH